MAADKIEAAGRVYTLFARPSAKDPNRVWWYTTWHTDADGQRQRIRRSTGKRLKTEAVEFIKKLEGTPGDTFAEFSQGFFRRGTCPYIAYKELRGGLRDHTVAEHYHNLHTYLIPEFGDYHLADLAAPMIEQVIHSLKRELADGRQVELSRSKKDGVWRSMRIVLEEAVRAGKIQAVPLVRLLRGKSGSAKRNALTRAEVAKLFPDSLTELEHIWRMESLHANGSTDTGKAASDPYGLTFGIFFRVMLHAGLRPGEARAMTKDCLFPAKNLLWVKRQVNVDDRVGDPKMSRDSNARTRFVQIPKSTMDMLVWLAGTRQGDYLFVMQDGSLVDRSYPADRFRVGLANAGIDPGDRKLEPYSLRYTYRSRLEGTIDNATIREWMGHHDQETSDGYLDITADQVEGWQGQQEAVEAVWIHN
jgi:integrase